VQTDHPNLVRLYEIFDCDDYMYLVMELMTGGELFDRIVEKESYTEKEAADTIRPIVDAIRYCHEMGFIHRDLKPENLLYETNSEDSVIKISDFGLARYLPQEQYATTACGTPGYVAPEIISGKGYGKEVDIWSIGIVLYILLCGFPPFYEENNAELFEKIKQGEFEFNSPYWDDVSESAKDLIRKLLNTDSQSRLSSEEILDHPWLVSEDTPRKELNQCKEEMSKFNAKRRLKRAANSVIAANRFQSVIKKLGGGSLA